MARSESTISPYPSGAGRADDWFFPDPSQMFQTSSSANQFRNRLSGATLPAVVGGFGGGGATLNTLSGTVGGGGSPTASPTSSIAGNGAGTGQIFRPGANGPACWVNIKKSGVGYIAGADAYAVTNVSAILAYTGGVGSQALDGGLQFTQDGGRLVVDGRAGIGFMRTGPNELKLGLIAVNLGAITLTTVATGGVYVLGNVGAAYDETVMHKQQFIFVGATAQAEATVTAYMDGVPVKVFTWTPGAAGVTMPDMGGVSCGFIAQIIVGANVTVQLRIPAGYHISHAPTVADTL